MNLEKNNVQGLLELRSGKRGGPCLRYGVSWGPERVRCLQLSGGGDRASLLSPRRKKGRGGGRRNRLESSG